MWEITVVTNGLANVLVEQFFMYTDSSKPEQHNFNLVTLEFFEDEFAKGAFEDHLRFETKDNGLVLATFVSE